MEIKNNHRKKKKKKRWGKTEKKYAIVASIAALAGILLYIFAVINYSDDVDYASLPQVTSESEASILEGYSGKVLISGMLTGTTYTFQEAYENVEMEEQCDAEGDFLYTELIFTRQEKYVKNQRQVDLQREEPQYDYRSNDYVSIKQAENLNIYGLAVEMDNLTLIGTTEYGELYSVIGETAKLEGLEGPEVPVVIVATMENGVLVNGTLEVNGSIEKAIADAKGSLSVLFVLLLVWLGLCGFVIFSMYLQRK